MWLNRNQIAELFGRDVKTIGKHINNALKEELSDQVVVAKLATTTKHGAINHKRLETLEKTVEIQSKMLSSVLEIDGSEVLQAVNQYTKALTLD